MGKSVIVQNTGDGRCVHRAIGRGDDIHRRYGLWIIGGSTLSSHTEFASRPWRSFDFYNLSHFWAGGGCCAFESGGERRLTPGECIVITPGIVHRYGNLPGTVYSEDSLKFQGPVADMLFDAGVLRSGVYPLGPVRKVRAIAEAARDPSVSAQINANGALQQLLIELYNLHRNHRGGTDALDEVLEAIKRSPERWWTVEELAECANSSPAVLRRKFLRHTGMLPKKYIEEFKMHRAAELLHEGAHIADVAAMLGYRDMYHFARRFKLRFGVPPGRFRAENA